MMNRRQFVGAAGATVGSTAWALSGAAPAGAFFSGLVNLASPLAPELVSVDIDGFSAWWVTAGSSDTTVRFARADGGPVRQVTLERGVRVHAARIEGLEPGVEYRYELRSGGHTVRRTRLNPGRVRTLAPPRGRLLSTVAFMNDLHVGEECSGILTRINGQPVPGCFRAPDYAANMVAGAIAEIKQFKPDFLLANGDLTDTAEAGEVDRVRGLLDGSGVPWRATRGNHDRRGQGPLDPACGPDRDCFRDQLFPAQAIGDSVVFWSQPVGSSHTLIGLDSCDPQTGRGRLDLGGQVAWLDATLADVRRQGRRAIVAFHHPITPASAAAAFPGSHSGVPLARGGDATLRVLGAYRDTVAIVLHGHTHRNFVSYDGRVGPNVPFLEAGAIKEYPALWHLLRIYEDGIVRTSHRPRDGFTKSWTQTSAGQVFGQQPLYTRGPLSSRSFTLDYDCRGSRPRATGLLSTEAGLPAC